MDKLKIVYMGTPEFAVPTLQKLIENNYKPVAVVTAPDKPAGRGRKPKPSAVKIEALKHHIEVLQPTNLKSDDFNNRLKQINPDLQIVVAFRMLPEMVWALPRLGTFNLHASLLPKYRGAAPIQHAVINGETESGVTTFMLKHAIDTGDIILQEKVQIGDTETAGELYLKLMNLGADVVIKSVALIEEGSLELKPQVGNKNQLPNAPKITPEFCQLNFNMPAKQVFNKIRGLAPFPGAWTVLNGTRFKIIASSVTTESTGQNEPGSVKTDNKTYAYVACADKYLALEVLQAEGRKRLPITELLKGFSF